MSSPKKVVQVPATVRALARKRRWTDEDARRVIEAGRASGQSWSRFAAALGLDVGRLYRWRERLRQSEADDRAAPGFVSFVAAPAVDAMIEVVTESGRQVRIGAAVPPALAVAVLETALC